MAGQWWADDDELGAALHEALREARDTPRSFVEAGKAAYAWHGIDAELARLSYDSATSAPDERHAAATRTTADPDVAALRSLTFVAARLTIELDVTTDAVLGQVVPPQPGQLELRPGTGRPRTIPIDDAGWFAIQPIPTGPFRLHCATTDGTTALTDWITL